MNKQDKQDLTRYAREKKEFEELIEAIRPMLADKGAEVQGCVLAELVATWVAGHVALGDPKTTKMVHEQVLQMHVVAVEALVDINYKTSVEPQIKSRMQ